MLQFYIRRSLNRACLCCFEGEVIRDGFFCHVRQYLAVPSCPQSIWSLLQCKHIVFFSYLQALLSCPAHLVTSLRSCGPVLGSNCSSVRSNPCLPYFTGSEYAELERSHEDHCVQLLALQRIPQQSHPVPESNVQTLLYLRQAGGCDPIPGELLQCQTTLWVKNLFLVSNLNFP